jgi:hypothetical protein
VRRWRRVSHPRRIHVLLVAFVCTFVCIVGFELYQVVVPFHTQNPLWNEATIGEPVIDQWKYEGFDEEGYLTFSNGKDNAHSVLSPTAKMLALDGKFVIIEKARPESLIYALPYEAIPMKWMIVSAAIVAALIGFVIVRIRIQFKRRPIHFKRSHRPGNSPVSGLSQFRNRTRRFKPGK